MSAPTDQFPRDTSGLPAATRDRARRAGRGPALPAADRAGRQAARRRHRADAGLQRLHSRADAEGPPGLGDRRRRRQRGRPGGRPCTGTACAWTTAPTARTRRRRRSRSAAASPAASRSRIPASTGTTRTSARTTGRRWASTATSSSSPRTPTTGRRRTASCALTLDDVLLEDGQIAPFSRSETNYAAMGRFGNMLLIAGEPELALTRQAGRGGAPLPDQHRQHARVQGRAARRADEARRRRQRPLRARGVRRGGRSWRRRSARSSTCCSSSPASSRSSTARPRRSTGWRTIAVGDERAEPSLAEAFEQSCAATRSSRAERERLAPVAGGRAGQDAGLRRRDGLRRPADGDPPSTPARCTPRSSPRSRAAARAAA